MNKSITPEAVLEELKKTLSIPQEVMDRLTDQEEETLNKQLEILTRFRQQVELEYREFIMEHMTEYLARAMAPMFKPFLENMLPPRAVRVALPSSGRIGKGDTNDGKATRN